MSDPRDDILRSVRRALGRSGPASGQQPSPLDEWLAKRPHGVVPARARREHHELVRQFRELAEAVQTTVTEVSAIADVPDAVMDYLRRENLAARAVMAPDPALDQAPWDGARLLEIRRGRPDKADQIGITSAFAAVAETGTLVMLSGPEHPSTLNFLPETHVVVLPEDRIVGSYEDAWDLLRQRTLALDGRLPRTVNMVTGPSRSGDIEQTIQLGAHGPRRLHIILVMDRAA
ncbi:MAG: lactate utilization protein C [Alphaproteobacteria bacterium]